jgi:tRNA dimethylallyltransferase
MILNLKFFGLTMQWRDLPQPLIVIVGPTAVGKTEIAIQLAERMQGEIVSADSRLFYRGMEIGTAKPTLEEQARVAHHLIDVADPAETWSLVLFQKAAKRIIADIHRHQKLPFLVGGTGQYIQAVIEEWEIPTQTPDFRLRDTLEAWGKQIGPELLHEKLSLIDPDAAARIEHRNLRRTVRALEVIFHTGQKFSTQRRKGQTAYQICEIGLIRPRAELYQRIDDRIEKMIEAGFLDEVKCLLERGYSPDLPTFSAIGYRELVQVVQGTLSLDEAIVLMKRYSRQFVRRQANWFSANDPAIHWFDLSYQTVDEIYNFLVSGNAWP